MDGQRRKPVPPRINIGDVEMADIQRNHPQYVEDTNDSTLVGDRHDVDLASMEARYAEALADSSFPDGKDDRDDLAKPEGMPSRKFSARGQAAARKHGGEDMIPASHPSTPETETEFDWDEADSSDEEEKQANEHAKEVEEHHRHKHNVKRAKRLRKVYLACMRLSRPVRTLLFLLIGCGILVIPAVVVWTRYNHAPNQVRDNVRVWSLWLCILWGSACATSLLVDAIPWMASKISILLVGLYPQPVKAKVTLFDGAKFWLKLLLTTVWAWVSLSILSDHIYTNPYLDYFRWILHACQSSFASAIVLYIEKLIVQSVKASFHQNALKDRIEENARAIWALDKLAASKKNFKKPKLAFRAFGHGRGINTPVPSRPASRASSPEDRRRGSYDRLQTQARSSTDNLNSMNSRAGDTVVDVPLTPVGERQSFADRIPHLRQRSGKMGGFDRDSIVAEVTSPRDGSFVPGTASPDHFKDHRTKKYFRRRANSKTIAVQLTEALSTATLKDKSRNTINTTHSAKKMARQLFEGLGHERDVLEPEDFIPYFATRADAEAAFALFDKDGNGDISKKEMRSAVSRIYRERKALKASLEDMGSAVRKLDGVLLGVSFIIILFIWFLIFDKAGTVSSLTSISTIVAALSFIFSNAASTLFNSMIFIFSTQPYSIGDLVFIDGDPLIVKEFGLMSTVFERVDGQYMLAPNSVLSSAKHILNVQRSGSMWETTNIQVSIDTPLEVMSELRSKMRQYVNENSREWGGGLEMNVNAISNQNSIEIIVAMQHKSNWQDWGGRWNRRTKLMRHMKTVLDELNVTYTLPVQPVQLQVRGGQSPFRSRRGSNSSNAGPGYNTSATPSNIDSRFLSPDALGNGARIGGGSYQPSDINRRTDASA